MKSIAYIPGSDGAANASLMTVSTVRAPLASTILVNTVANVPDKFFASMGTPNTFIDPITGETITVISEATAVDFAGHIDGSNIEIDAIAPGYTDNGSEVGDIIVIRPITEWANNIHDLLAEAHQDDGKLKVTALDEFYKPSEVLTTNFVASGGAIATVSGLTGSFADIVYYLNGLRATKTGIANNPYTASRDTYIDIGEDGTVDYNAVTNGATPPALAANHIRVAKVVTNGSALTTITLLNRVNSAPRFEVVANSSTSLGQAAWTKINYLSEQFDIGDNVSASVFTVPRDGYYTFSAAASMTVNGAESYILGFYKNGSEWRRGNRIVQGAGSGTPLGLVGNVACTYLVAGDTIDVRVYNGSGGGKSSASTAYENHFSGAMLFPA